MYGQYTDVINSNRPGFSESPYSVGTGVYQFETSIFNTKITGTPTINRASALGLDLSFRTSFFLEKLEFSLNTALQGDNVSYKNDIENTYDKTGFSKFTLGAKYLVFIPTYKDRTKIIRSWKKRTAFDWNRWIPHIGVYAGFNFGGALTNLHKRGGITPKLGVLLQNEFSHKLNVITNVYYDYIGSENPAWNYMITGTYNFTDEWSGYAEYQGESNKATPKKNNLGIGAAYLFNENLQLNASARAIFQEKAIGYYVGIGASYRINRHKDKFVAVDEYGNKIEEDKPIKYTENKGFFGRLFDKLFKKQDTSKEINEDGKEIDTSKSTGRTRQKSILGDLAKKDQKLKKTTKKEKEKEAKRTRREEEKLKRQIEKEKRKEEKEKRKEEERLRKEEEKLQKELEKEKMKEQKKQMEEDEKNRKAEEKIEKEIQELEEKLKKEKEEKKEDE